VAVGESFDGGDVQEGDQRPAVGSGRGDEKTAFHHDGQTGVADFVGIPAAARPSPYPLPWQGRDVLSVRKSLFADFIHSLPVRVPWRSWMTV
jgi:hypothetical protein